MIAYKGFTKELTATMGKSTFQYREGGTYEEEYSKCARGGFHCAEDPFNCFDYYRLGNGNRYFMVEAEGSLDEDGSDTKISCTRITLLRELNLKELGYHKLKYMILHPKRDWKKTGFLYEVAEERAEGKGKGSVAIARGKNPMVRGKAGSVLGLLCEPEPELFTEAKVFEVTGGIRPDTWYRLKDGKLQEVEKDEAEKDYADRTGQNQKER